MSDENWLNGISLFNLVIWLLKDETRERSLALMFLL